MEIGIYVPQVALSFEDVRHRAERCEELGIRSLWLYDHLYGPGLPPLPSLESWTLATALLACTRTLRVGHLVLCNQFRHPALLAHPPPAAPSPRPDSDALADAGAPTGDHRDQVGEAQVIGERTTTI